jgi:chromosome segregation protein
MHLKSLELTGFKSFAEAKIEFPSGVTSVVGPNGTGKSNVVDAMLWVLGEQSAKTLRSEKMEDVIFNGTEMRKPLGMAEVSLIMAGIDEERLKGLPALPHQLSEFHEVMITRRLYRNGDSEYLINKSSCRLKDVRALFLDSRAGTKGHTIIEQGRIEQILNATPQDRRELIEETAGIVRYKKQKAEALRKLDSTQQNLLRVKDIIAEVRRQLNSLERQARQARSYQNLQAEAKTLEVRLLAHECRALLVERASVEAQLSDVESREVGYVTDQGRLESELEHLKMGLVSGGEGVSRIRHELGEVEQQQSQALTTMEVEKGRLALYEQQRVAGGEELTRLTADAERTAAAAEALRNRLSSDEAEVEERLQACAEVEEQAKTLAARRAAGQAEEEQARQSLVAVTVQTTRAENALSSLAAQEEQTLRRIERLGQELAEIEAQHADVMERCHGAASGREEHERTAQELRTQVQATAEETRRLEEQVRESEGTIRQQQEGLAAIESRLKALQGVLREEMGYGREGEEEGTSLRAACAGVKESVAEWLIVPPGLERAVEAVLGERLHAWLISEPADARRAIDFLNHQALGRGAFVPAQPRYRHAAAGQAEEWWLALEGQSGVLGRAVDLLRADTESQDVLASLFASVVIVHSLDVAVEQWRRGLWSAPNGPTLVTIDGEVLDAAGIVTGGTAGSTGGLLLRRREVQRLEEERRDVSQSLGDHRSRLAALLAQAQEGRETVQRLDHAIRQADMQILGFVKDESAFRRTVEELTHRLETIRTECRIQEEERSRSRQVLEETRIDLQHQTEEKLMREAALEHLQHSLRAYEDDSLALQHRLTDTRLALASVRAKLEHGEADLNRLGREHEGVTTRMGVLAQQLGTLAASTDQSRIEAERSERLFSELEQRAIHIRQDLQAAQEQYDRDAQAAQGIDRQLASVRQALTACREARLGIEVRRAELATQLAVRESTLMGTYQLSLEATLAQEPAEQNLTQSDQPSDQPPWREQLQKIRDRLDRLGPINLAAIDEHRELEERHRFLTTQEEDLSKSVASLKEIITRINRTTKEMFMETFNELQQKFVEVFARFFPGGRAELVLVQPEPDPEGAAGPDEPGVDIAAQPPGKRLKSITMLSGGEKTLTAMALIFASFLIRPTPFCILDEIDAPLDEENIGRFTAVLRELSSSAQFIVITHNKRTMAIADSLFGVTMEEPGVSKLISVRLADLQPV